MTTLLFAIAAIVAFNRTGDIYLMSVFLGLACLSGIGSNLNSIAEELKEIRKIKEDNNA